MKGIINKIDSDAEREFVERFVLENRRERVFYLLGHPQKRKSTLWDMEKYLDLSKFQRIDRSAYENDVFDELAEKS